MMCIYKNYSAYEIFDVYMIIHQAAIITIQLSLYYCLKIVDLFKI